MRERIQKVLSAEGYCSRRTAEKLVAAGRVKINGHIAQPGAAADAARDVITVDGERVGGSKRAEKLYFMLNKPRGYVTTMDDRHADRTVADLVLHIGVRLFPVGRLDKDSEGLLLMTNDGDFANMVSHPSGGLGKTYRVSVRPGADEAQLSALASGVRLDDGPTLPASVRVTGEGDGRTVFEITVREGRNRQIRRMCEAVGLSVVRLKRTAVGPLRLGPLPSGSCRPLTRGEVKAVCGSGRKSKI